MRSLDRADFLRRAAGTAVAVALPFPTELAQAAPALSAVEGRWLLEHADVNWVDDPMLLVALKRGVRVFAAMVQPPGSRWHFSFPVPFEADKVMLNDRPRTTRAGWEIATRWDELDPRTVGGVRVSAVDGPLMATWVYRLEGSRLIAANETP